MNPGLPVGVLAGLLIASRALASGVDLTLSACPGSPGAGVSFADMSCAGGESIEMVVSFEPSVSYTDLVGADWIMDVFTAGELGSTANFWDFAAVNAGAVTLARTIPAARCEGFTLDVWSAPGSGGEWSASARGPSELRVAGIFWRALSFQSAVDQRIFGCRILIDTAASVDRAGTLEGCCEFATEFVLQQLTPVTMNAGPMYPLTTPGLASNMLTLGCATAVPARPRTWGGLKSLYR